MTVVHVSAEHGGGLILNTRAGRWYALNATAELLVGELRRTGDIDAAVHTISARFPTVSEHRIRADAEALLTQLWDRKLVALVGSAAVMVCEAQVPAGSGRAVRRHRLRSLASLVLAILLLRLPFSWATRIVAGVRRLAWKPAAVGKTAELVSAIDRAARRCPCRAACLEKTVAAVLASALSGRRLDWALGVAEDPYRFHCWVEADGRAVVSPEDSSFSDFRRVLVM